MVEPAITTSNSGTTPWEDSKNHITQPDTTSTGNVPVSAHSMPIEGAIRDLDIHIERGA